MKSVIAFCLAVLLVLSSARADIASAGPAGSTASQMSDWLDQVNSSLVDFYQAQGDPDAATVPAVAVPAGVLSGLIGPAQSVLLSALPGNPAPGAMPLIVGRLRARAQQAMILQMADAVRDGRVADAQAWRVEMILPRGVSANEGALLLQTLPADPTQRADVAKVLTREAITWQTARVRQLLTDMNVAAGRPGTPMPGRLDELMGEATALADLPPALREAAELDGPALLDPASLASTIAAVDQHPWTDRAAPVADFSQLLQTHLPALLTPTERERHERLLLKLVLVIPKEYLSAGVLDGQVTTPLEYREAVTFAAQARQFADELAPLWLNENAAKFGPPLKALEQKLTLADQDISAKRASDDLAAVLKDAAAILQDQMGVSLRRGGTTADIVDEVMLETRSLLSQSLAAANQGNWSEASSLRLEAYTTYDPDLEARLMPRDPQLTTDIEHLLLDGLDKPGVKTLLDQHVNGPDLEAAYSRVNDALDKAAALLKSGVSPTAAAFNAGSIVLREGLEGLLVIVAILAGLRGDENRRKRYMIWLGVVLSMVATVITVILSQTVITRLHSYGEVIEAITSILAIGVLLLITNWLFHQIYWRQWVCTLKSQAERDGVWQLISVGFLIGYREGFETVLFLQSLMLDVGAKPILAGVSVGLVLLTALGMLAIVAGMRLPYFKLLLGTAVLIGIVLITFVGTGVRSMQTVGWLPVHKIVSASWPTWTGQWLGVYNTWETIVSQGLTAVMVLGTWRVSRWRAHRAAQQRQAANAVRRQNAPLRHALPVQQSPAQAGCSDPCEMDFVDPNHPCPAEGREKPAELISIRVPEPVEELASV